MSLQLICWAPIESRTAGAYGSEQWLNGPDTSGKPDLQVHLLCMRQVPSSLRLEPIRLATGNAVELTAGASIPATGVTVLNGSGQHVIRGFLAGDKHSFSIVQRLWRLTPAPGLSQPCECCACWPALSQSFLIVQGFTTHSAMFQVNNVWVFNKCGRPSPYSQAQSLHRYTTSLKSRRSNTASDAWKMLVQWASSLSLLSAPLVFTQVKGMPLQKEQCHHKRSQACLPRSGRKGARAERLQRGRRQSQLLTKRQVPSQINCAKMASNVLWNLASLVYYGQK